MTYTPLQPTWADRMADTRWAAWLRKYLLCGCLGLLVAANLI